VDRRISESVRAKLLGIGGSDRGGRDRQLPRVVAEGAGAVVEVGLAVVVLGVRRKLG